VKHHVSPHDFSHESIMISDRHGHPSEPTNPQSTLTIATWPHGCLSSHDYRATTPLHPFFGTSIRACGKKKKN
jgi:hypothetical protein